MTERAGRYIVKDADGSVWDNFETREQAERHAMQRSIQRQAEVTVWHAGAVIARITARSG